MKIKCVLIVDSNEDVTLRKKMPFIGNLRETQIAIPLTVMVPDAWFTACRTDVIVVTVPEPEFPDIEVTAAEVA